MLTLLKRMLSSLLTIAVSVFVLLSVFVYVFQGQLVYFPSQHLVLTPRDIHLPYEDVSLESTNGNRIHGWYIPHPHARAQLLFLHGNGGNISHRLDSLNIFYNLGLSTLIIDYQGYGQSEGTPSEQATYDDAQVALNFLLEKNPATEQPVIIFGRSLGGAVAGWLATQHTPAALIIESTFTSVMDMGKKYYPFLPVTLLTRYRYDTLSRIGSVGCPLLVVHSPDDEIVPYTFGETLYSHASEPKHFLQIRGGHNDGFISSGTLYLDGIADFLDKHLNNPHGLTATH
ncbi:MAG: alpha/beta hydrolase [Thiotrichales bacterium]|nr:alpha/beta hydrolase [Thiotrichales bacterium]